MLLSNMVCQGSALGPPLWNAFVGDDLSVIERAGVQAVIFADNLDAYRPFPRDVSNTQMYDKLCECRR